MIYIVIFIIYIFNYTPYKFKKNIIIIKIIGFYAFLFNHKQQYPKFKQGYCCLKYFLISPRIN